MKIYLWERYITILLSMVALDFAIDLNMSVLYGLSLFWALITVVPNDK